MVKKLEKTQVHQNLTKIEHKSLKCHKSTLLFNKCLKNVKKTRFDQNCLRIEYFNDKTYYKITMCIQRTLTKIAYFFVKSMYLLSQITY